MYNYEGKGGGFVGVEEEEGRSRLIISQGARDACAPAAAGVFAWRHEAQGRGNVADRFCRESNVP